MRNGFVHLCAVLFLTALGSGQAFCQQPMSESNAAIDPNSASQDIVATPDKPAVYPLPKATEQGTPEALEVTVRPVGSNVGGQFLVQVYAREVGSSANGAENFIGSFSFFPLHPGKKQTFVLASPELDRLATSAPENLQLEFRLVPANPSATLKDTAVEVLGARFVR